MTDCADHIRVICPLFQMEYGGASPTSALQLQITEATVHLACRLNKLWHSRLPNIHWSNIVRNTHYVCYVASYNNVYYATAIWSSPVAQNRLLNGDTILELRRLAISDDAPKNTASRMIRIMKNNIVKKYPDITKLISYQDTEVHAGIIYKASGWKSTTTSPGISWSTNNRTRNTEQTKAPKIRWEYIINK